MAPPAPAHRNANAYPVLITVIEGELTFYADCRRRTGSFCNF
jgi:hypothetical protein